MKFKIHIKNSDNDWWEDFNKPEVHDQGSAETCSKRMIDRYNDTLYPGDKPRTLLEVVFGEGKESESHDWQKVNLMTLKGQYAMYDEMRCKNCGITGKRYGLEGVSLDSQFGAKAFQHCNTSRELLQKRKQRKVS